MIYIIAILSPPLAVLFCGRPLQAIVNLVFTLFLWVPRAIHALLICADYEGQRREERIAIRVAKRL